MKYILLSLLLVSVIGNSFTQEFSFISNGKFQDHDPCNQTNEIILKSKNWQTVAGYPMFFNISCPMPQGNKTLLRGKKMPPAFIGNTYLGMAIEEQSDYIQVELDTTLTANQIYKVSIHARLPFIFCNRALNGIGFTISSDTFPYNATPTTFNHPNAQLLRKPNGKIFNDVLSWEKLEGYIVATGEEKYLTLGNFKYQNYDLMLPSLVKKPQKSKSKNKSCSYVFIDNVVLTPKITPTLVELSSATTLVRNVSYYLPLNDSQDSLPNAIIDKIIQAKAKCIVLESYAYNSTKESHKSICQKINTSVMRQLKSKLPTTKFKQYTFGQAEINLPNRTGAYLVLSIE